MHTKALELELICNISKTDDQILRVTAVLQKIESSLHFLQNNLVFNPSAVNLADQPLLPDVLTIKVIFVHKAIRMIELFQLQKDTFKEE